MSDVYDFGFDEAKAIKVNQVDKFSQKKHGEINIVSIVSFKKFQDVIFAEKSKEKGSPLTDHEKSEFDQKIRKNLSERLNKPVDSLTEVDFLQLNKPKFSFSYTHYQDGIGLIRCVGKYENGVLSKAGLCCDKIGDAEQTIATVIMTYPMDDTHQVDSDLLKAKKYTNFYVWRLNAKKYKKIESVYTAARNDNREVIDMKVTLDGDPKYQKQMIENHSSAFWARDSTDPEVRRWVLEMGLKNAKHVPTQLGFQMTADKLADRLGGGSSAPAEEEKPRLVSGYSSLIE